MSSDSFSSLRPFASGGVRAEREESKGHGHNEYAYILKSAATLRRDPGSFKIDSPGTTNATRQALEVERPFETSELYTAGMTKYVTPPPALPNPPVRALAVPTTFLSKTASPSEQLSADQRRLDDTHKL